MTTLRDRVLEVVDQDTKYLIATQHATMDSMAKTAEKSVVNVLGQINVIISTEHVWMAAKVDTKNLTAKSTVMPGTMERIVAAAVDTVYII